MEITGRLMPLKRAFRELIDIAVRLEPDCAREPQLARQTHRCTHRRSQPIYPMAGSKIPWRRC